MLAKEFEDLPIKDAQSSNRVTVSQSLLFQGEEGSRKPTHLKKVLSISELWTCKQQQEEAGSILSLHYEQNVLYSYICVFSTSKKCSEIPICIWAIHDSAPLVTEQWTRAHAQERY